MLDSKSGEAVEDVIAIRVDWFSVSTSPIDTSHLITYRGIIQDYNWPVLGIYSKWVNQNIITARIGRMGEGNSFSLLVCPHRGGGGYPPWSRST